MALRVPVEIEVCRDYILAVDGDGEPVPVSVERSGALLKVEPERPGRYSLCLLWPAGRFGRCMVWADGLETGRSYDLGERILTTALRRVARRADELGVDAKAGLRRAHDLARNGYYQEALGEVLFFEEELEDAASCAAGRKERFYLGLGQYNWAALPFDERYARPFNLAVVPFYIPGLMTGEDGYDWGFRHEAAAAAHARGMLVKGHPLVWFFEPHTPEWLARKAGDLPAILDFVERHLTRVVTEFRGEIDIWDATNELHDWANSLELTPEGQLAVVDAAVRAVKAADPSACVVVNSCLPWGLYVTWGRGQHSPYWYYERLIERGVPFDVVGLQLYNAMASPFPFRDIPEMRRLIDRYARLGKPIHVTEFAVPSSGAGFGSYHGDEWTEAAQAGYVERFYRMCYAHPAVEGVTWWGITDMPPGHEWVSSGLLRQDGTPKPSWEVVAKLAREWGIISD